MTPDGHIHRSSTQTSAAMVDAEIAFAELRRRLRHHSRRWYYGCRLRSLGASLLDSMKYLQFGVTGAYAFAELHDQRTAAVPKVTD